MSDKRLSFADALQSGKKREIRKIPKADLHHHCLMGGRRSDIERFSGIKIPAFRPREGNISELNHWISHYYRPILQKDPGAFQKALEAAFRQAKRDGITVLESSIDCSFGALYRIEPIQIVSMLKVVHETVAPGTTFRPELGIIRSRPVGELQPLIEAFLCLDYFRSIDLYDDEFSRPVSSFRSIYRMAKSLGLKCKAHAGEFGNADSVKEAAEELELDAIQHGIAAASSPAVMYWLADNHITLNVCPTSNIKLKRCRSYKTHPVRILYDHGVRVTINSDDILVFGSEVSSEYLRLFRSGLFNSKELDQIRLNGLNENA